MICLNCFKETLDGQFCGMCGYQHAKSRPSKALPPLAQLCNRYVIGRVLGVGGFGITYKAFDKKKNKIVALKECFPAHYSHRNGWAIVANQGHEMEFNDCCNLFKREYNILYAIKGTYGVTNIDEVFFENKTYYYSMNYIHGIALNRLMKSNGGIIPYAQSLYVLIEISNILLTLHNNGIVHRDISPENIMIDVNGDVSLIDFGTATYYNAPSNDNGVFLKHGFAPPEQYILNSDYGVNIDIYALAATFYAISTGRPLVASTDRLEKDTLKPLALLEDYTGSTLMSNVIGRAMQPDRYDRISDITELFSCMVNEFEYAEPFTDRMLSIVRMRAPNESKNGTGSTSLSRRTSKNNAYIVVMTGENKGVEVKIPDFEFVTIGRDPKKCNLILNDYPEISRVHCMVGYDAYRKRFVIVDKSSMGTYYSNGSRMLLDMESYIFDGDEFSLFNSSLRIKTVIK